MKKTLEEIQKEMDQMDYVLEKLCKIQHFDWDLQDKMRYGRLLAMKKRRLEEMQREEV